MIGILLKILSFIGIVLLWILLLLIILILLVLFCPICYKAEGKAESDTKILKVKVSWLSGFLRVIYSFPEDGAVKAKLLCFTVFNSKRSKKATGEKLSEKKEQSENSTGERKSTEPVVYKSESSEKKDDSNTEYEKDSNQNEASKPSSDLKEKKNFLEKIKYTIQNICDKIKHIVDNIAYYKELLQEENTKQLWLHVKIRLGKIFKSIFPKHVRADITFGAASPDITGYVCAAYGIILPYIGKKIRFTPDFQQAIINGNFKLSGHITCCVLLVNGLALLFDKKMKKFINKMKAGRKQNG